MALRCCFPLLLVLLPVCRVLAQDGPPDHPQVEIASSHPLRFGSAVLQVDFAAGDLDLPSDAILGHVKAAASAVTAYYGGFPVARARLLLVPVAGRRGIMQGTTWPGMNGFEGFTRIRIGQHTTTSDLAEDWMTTHELVHMAFPTLPDDQHWMEEGLATYVEPIARVATGELEARQVWRDMVRGMPKGEPGDGDLGLDRTHTWGRTYWGGALFCLVADVTIRRETENRKSLQDALRAVVAQGGTIDHEWALDKALAIGDRATGTHVLTRMYGEWKDKPVPVDLMKLWGELGIHWTPGGPIEFVASAPLARIRESIAGERSQAQPAAVSGMR
jgi:hypothetical protein